MQAPVGPEQVRVPIMPAGHADPRARQLPHTRDVVHGMPVGSIVHPRDSDRVAPSAHAPATQLGAPHVRLWVPDVAQPVTLEVHALQSEHVSLPHVVPSVSREHGSSRVVDLGPQLPEPHTRDVVVTERAPLSMQALAYRHVPESITTSPHIVPSVVRPQALSSVSPTFIVTHAPPAHTCVTTLRVRAPSVEHVLSSYAQALHAPIDGVPHGAPSVVREHASLSVLAAGSHVPALQA